MNHGYISEAESNTRAQDAEQEKIFRAKYDAACIDAAEKGEDNPPLPQLLIDIEARNAAREKKAKEDLCCGMICSALIMIPMCMVIVFAIWVLFFKEG